MRTAEVRILVREVLDKLSKPYSHHVIDEVFLAIEQNAEWRTRYDALCSILGRDVVNNWGGRWVGITLGKVGEQQVPSKKSTLIGSYSILDTDAKTSVRKPTESEALQSMAVYFQAHKAELSPNVRTHRQTIVQLIMDGIPPAEAFLMVSKSDA